MPQIRRRTIRYCAFDSVSGVNWTQSAWKDLPLRRAVAVWPRHGYRRRPDLVLSLATVDTWRTAPAHIRFAVRVPQFDQPEVPEEHGKLGQLAHRLARRVPQQHEEIRGVARQLRM